MPELTITNEDCMELMKRYDDNHFELAIVDPPYGINAGKGTEIYLSNNGKVDWKGKSQNDHTIYGEWDNKKPSKEYFAELKRVSKHLICWGGNYFLEHFNSETGVIIWDKLNGESFFADGEFAIHNFNNKLRIFKKLSCGFMGSHKDRETRIHPTQKPIALYKWLLQNYAKPGDKILDTHLGSGSIAIACHYASHDLTACELDTDYYNAAMDRIERETKQLEFEDLL